MHVVIGVFQPRAERDAGREMLFERKGRRGDAVAAVVAVAVGGVAPDGARRRAVEIVVQVVRAALRVVGEHLEGRAEGVDPVDVVERGGILPPFAVQIVGAPVGGQHTVGGQVGARIVGPEFRIAVVLELHADAVALAEFIDGPCAHAEVAVFFAQVGVGDDARGARPVGGLFVGYGAGAAEPPPARAIEVEFAAVVVEVETRVVVVLHRAVHGVECEAPVQPVVALAPEVNPDRPARGVGVVVGARRGDHLDLADILCPQRTKVAHQLAALHAELPVVDVNLRAGGAVDGNLLVVDPHPRRLLQQVDPVLADRRRRIGHVHYETVGFAAYQSGLDHHAADLGRRGRKGENSQGRAVRDAHLLRKGFVADKLYQ